MQSICPSSLHRIASLALYCICACNMQRGHMAEAINNNIISAMPPSTHQRPLAASTGAAVDLNHRRRRWRSSLASGLRTALACAVVGVVSVYAPPTIRRHITFPAFSYVVTVIIVTDATLGSALRAAVSALHATIMGAVPSVVALWLAHRTGAAESVLATTAVVALSTFAVALPESAGPVAKRIALGQIIIIYVARFKQGEHPSHAFALLHPSNVVACTALGVAAALIAVLLPCPRLATREVAEKDRAYAEMAAERVRLLVDAFLVVNKHGTCAVACSTRRRSWCMAAACMASLEAKRLASASGNLLRRISAIKGDTQWERVPLVLKSHCWVQQQHECVEMALGGMEIALESTTSCTAPSAAGAAAAGSTSTSTSTITNTNTTATMSCRLQQMRDQTRLALLAQNHHYTMSYSIISSTMSTLPESCEELAPYLFLFSMDLLLRGTTKASDPEPKLVAASSAAASSSQDKMIFDTTKVVPRAATQESTDGGVFYLSDGEFQELQGGGVVVGEDGDEEEQSPTKQNSVTTASKKKTKSNLLAAVKCALSLGLAVLLGLLFSNDHGFWSGLIVATTMTAGRESTWALGIARSHGTALGSVYGVLAGCLIAEMELRFLALLPWIVLATFLKRSRAYGPAGGVAAVLSVAIIVGRRYDEPPMAFTIARLVETFIGLSCTIVADLVFQPAARPSTKARAQLGRCLAALRDCFTGGHDASPASGKWKDYYSVAQEQVALLRKYAAEAGSEPTYLWLPPFPAACYDKIEGSLSRMAQLLWLYLQARRACTLSLRHHQRQLDGAEADVQRFHRIVSTSLNHLCFGEITKSSAIFQQAHEQEGNVSSGEHDLDLEAGKQFPRLHSSCCCEEAATAPETVVRSFLDHAREALALLVVLQQQEAAQEDGGREQQQLDDDGQLQLAVVCLASIGFCMGEMIKEALQLEAHMLDLALQTH